MGSEMCIRDSVTTGSEKRWSCRGRKEREGKEKEGKEQEMSIDMGVPDLKNEAKESDNANEEIQIENSARPDLQKGLKKSPANK